MKSTLTALLFMVFAAGFTAPSQVRTATIEGTVKNLRTNEPIADVRVTVTPESPPLVTKTGTTDAEGRFTISGVSPGRYTVSATRTLFFQPRRNPGAFMLTVADGERLSGLQILLSPTAVISGRVFDESRDPLRSVRVEALRRDFATGRLAWVSAAQSTSDDRGSYRLFNLQPGTYYVRATPTNAAPEYYPGGADFPSASPVQIDSGSEIGGIDVEMRRIPEYSVQFRLGGVPGGGTTMFLVRRKNGSIFELQVARPETLPDATYRLNRLIPGEYEVTAQVYTPPGVQPRTVTHAATFTVNVANGNVDLGTMLLAVTVPVTGRILVPAPLPSALERPRLALTLRSLDTITTAFSIRGNASSPGFADDGRFTIPNVAIGRYQILLTGLPADSYLVSAREGTREVLDTGFAVTGNQGPLQLTIGGPEAVGSFGGIVVNALGQPVPSSTVVLVPEEERRGNAQAFRSATTDQFGSFTIRAVLPGDYRALAWEDVEPGIYLDPEFLKNFETRGEAVRIERGSQGAATLRVLPAVP